MPERDIPTGVVLTGAFDPLAGTWNVAGQVAGPAGPAVIDLGPGVTVAMDFADPVTLNEILVAPLPGAGRVGGEAREVVVALLGADAARALFALEDPTRRRLPRDAEHAPVAGYRLAVPLGRAALLAELLAEGRLSAPAAAAAHQEGVLALAEAGLGSTASMVMDSARAGAASPTGGPDLTYPVDVLLGDARPAPFRAARRGDEVVVEGPNGTGPLWGRAFDDDGLMAVAPFSGSTCRLLVPAAVSPVAVDVTPRPEQPRPSPALVLARRAVTAGRAACRAERLDDTEEAARLWAECASAWAQVGDGHRSHLAGTYGSGSTPPEGSFGRRRATVWGGAFVADRL